MLNLLKITEQNVKWENMKIWKMLSKKHLAATFIYGEYNLGNREIDG